MKYWHQPRFINRVLRAVTGLAVTIGVAWASTAASAEEAAESTGVMGLTAHQPPYLSSNEAGDWYAPNLLYREMVRQGVLMVARDQFALSTRDQVLREILPGEGVVPGLFDIEVAYVHRRRVEYTLSQGDAAVFEATTQFPYGENETAWVTLDAIYDEMVGPLVEALKAQGLAHRPLPIDLEGGGVTEEMDAALGRMDVTSQFLAVRLAHAAMQTHGETRDLLGVLSRGYGNLSQLTVYHNNSMRYVFASRGLWYATRLIRLEPDAPFGHWYRAYVAGVFGCQFSSMWDLRSAQEVVEAMADPPATPRWAELIDLANFYRHDELEAAAQQPGAERELAALLWYRAAEFMGSNRINIDRGRRAIDIAPHCMRLHEGVNRVAGVRWGHRSTVESVAVLGVTLPVSLRRAARADPALAPWLGDAVGDCETVVGRHTFGHALRAAAGGDADRGEPSIAVLGMVVDEQNVMQIGYRAMFLMDNLGVESAPYLESVAPALDGHPHEELVWTLALPRHAERSEFERLLRGYHMAEGSYMYTRNGIVNRMPGDVRIADGKTARDLRVLLSRNSSFAEPEYVFRLLVNDEQERLDYARLSAYAIPNAPVRFTTYIELDWENNKQHAQEWERDHGHSPVVAFALAGQYERAGDPQQALALYEKYRQAAPDYAVYSKLCAIHWRMLADPDEAMRLAMEYFEQEDFGLGHATLAKDIAYTLMEEGDYEAALPWAQLSAESGAGWAYWVEAFCYEHLGRGDEAMRVWRRSDRRYINLMSVSAMYRVGIEPEQAWRSNERWVRERFPGNEEELVYARQSHDLVYAEPEVALASMERVMTFDHRPFYTIIAGLLAGRLGDEDKMRLYLRQAIDMDPEIVHPNLRPNVPMYQGVAATLLEAIDAGELDTESILLSAGAPGDLYYPNLLGLAAMTLDVIDPGSEEAAELWWEVAMSRYRWRIMPLYAMRRVRDLGDDPMVGNIRWEGLRTNLDLDFLDE